MVQPLLRATTTQDLRCPGSVSPRKSGAQVRAATAKRTEEKAQKSRAAPCLRSSAGEQRDGRHVLRIAVALHRPRKRAIQYSRGAGDGIEKPQRTGYPLAQGMTTACG